jgi:hypothetical protein
MPDAPTHPEFDPRRDKVIEARRLPKKYLKKRLEDDGGGYARPPRLDLSPSHRRRLASDSSSGSGADAVNENPPSVRPQVSYQLVTIVGYWHRTKSHS